MVEKLKAQFLVAVLLAAVCLPATVPVHAGTVGCGTTPG